MPKTTVESKDLNLELYVYNHLDDNEKTDLVLTSNFSRYLSDNQNDGPIKFNTCFGVNSSYGEFLVTGTTFDFEVTYRGTDVKLRIQRFSNKTWFQETFVEYKGERKILSYRAFNIPPEFRNMAKKTWKSVLGICIVEVYFLECLTNYTWYFSRKDNITNAE